MFSAFQTLCSVFAESGEVTQPAVEAGPGWFLTGERASEVLMSAVMTGVGARVPPRDARIYAVIHENNHRSIASPADTASPKR
jgi:hypothetical protein